MDPCAPPSAKPTAASPWTVVPAAPAWRHIDFISDLHLQPDGVATFATWQHYLRSTPADALFILGDLFEIWVGDDAMSSAPVPNFEHQCAQILQAAAQHLAVFLMHGNRDFLLGSTFAASVGATLLPDPSVLAFAGQRWLLSHGDALCLDDHDYMAFRSQVRSNVWQQEFLEKPLAVRQQIAQTLRQQSEEHKHQCTSFVDLDAQASCDWLRAAQASTLIHGHTHKPSEHLLAPGLRRIVLSDWDGAATPPRAEVLRLSVNRSGPTPSCTMQRLSLTQSLV